MSTEPDCSTSLLFPFHRDQGLSRIPQPHPRPPLHHLVLWLKSMFRNQIRHTNSWQSACRPSSERARSRPPPPTDPPAVKSQASEETDDAEEPGLEARRRRRGGYRQEPQQPGRSTRPASAFLARIPMSVRQGAPRGAILAPSRRTPAPARSITSVANSVSTDSPTASAVSRHSKVLLVPKKMCVNRRSRIPTRYCYSAGPRGSPSLRSRRSTPGRGTDGSFATSA